jgi:hypothetical protein
VATFPVCRPAGETTGEASRDPAEFLSEYVIGMSRSVWCGGPRVAGRAAFGTWVSIYVNVSVYRRLHDWCGRICPPYDAVRFSSMHPARRGDMAVFVLCWLAEVGRAENSHREK